MHPGCVDTEGFRKDPIVTTPVIGPIWGAALGLFFSSPAKGAYSTVFAAASPVVRTHWEKYKGAYLIPDTAQGGRIATPPDPRADSMELAEELWATTEGIVADLGL